MQSEGSRQSVKNKSKSKKAADHKDTKVHTAKRDDSKQKPKGRTSQSRVSRSGSKAHDSNAKRSGSKNRTGATSRSNSKAKNSNTKGRSASKGTKNQGSKNDHSVTTAPEVKDQASKTSGRASSKNNKEVTALKRQEEATLRSLEEVTPRKVLEVTHRNLERKKQAEVLQRTRNQIEVTLRMSRVDRRTLMLPRQREVRLEVLEASPKELPEEARARASMLTTKEMQMLPKVMLPRRTPRVRLKNQRAAARAKDRPRDAARAKVNPSQREEARVRVRSPKHKAASK